MEDLPNSFSHHPNQLATVAFLPDVHWQCLSPRGHESCVCRAVSWPHPSPLTRHPHLFGYWECCRNFLEKEMKKAGTGSGHESSFSSAGQPCKKHGLDCKLLFLWLNFLAALHEHCCILWYHDSKAEPALGRGQFLCTEGVHSNRGRKLCDLHWCHTGSAYAPWVKKTKAPDQPMRFCFLCGLYWCLLSTYILIYLEKVGDVQWKSLDIFGVEKQRVYQIIVTLSCSLKISWIFFGRII